MIKKKCPYNLHSGKWTLSLTGMNTLGHSARLTDKLLQAGGKKIRCTVLSGSGLADVFKALE